VSDSIVSKKEIEKQEHSSVKLTVTVKQEALKNEYTDLLEQYRRNSQIKGFRKGKAPTEVLERKYGEGIKQEAAANIIEKGLKEVFDEVEEKPLPYVPPTLQDDDINPDLERDYTFSVTYDVFPEVKLGTYTGLKVKEPVVQITDEDEKRELDNLRERNAFVTDKPDGAVEKDSIITIDYVELDENDQPKEDEKREGFVFTVGTGYNIHKIDDDVIGMKKGETRVFEKEYGEDFEIEVMRNTKVKLQVTVTAVKEKQLPELDDDLAQDISEKYETLDDLKKDIREKLQQAADQKVREKKINQIVEQIVENSETDIPNGMIAAELENSWQTFISRSRINEEQAERILAQEGRSKGDLMLEWRPAAEKRLKTRLVINKIIEEENIETADNEVDEQIKKLAESNDTDAEQLKAQYEQANYMEHLRDDIKDRKLFDFLLEKADISKGDKVKFLDIMQDEQ
jgi:trigger factor